MSPFPVAFGICQVTLWPGLKTAGVFLLVLFVPRVFTLVTAAICIADPNLISFGSSGTLWDGPLRGLQGLCAIVTVGSARSLYAGR